MSELMEALIKSLIANGVKVPAEEPVCLGGDKIACGNELDTVFNLDFSEHDKKVAEEKDNRIAELEKQISGYRERNILLRQRCTAEARDLFDCEMFGSLIITIPRKSNDNAIIEKLEEGLNRLTMDLKNRMGEIYELKEKNTELDLMRKRWLDTAVKLSEERFDLKRQIEMLETNGNESCKEEPVSDCGRPSIDWYEDRHQSDCIRINQLLTTIDVLTERYQKLREVHGL